jgi:putrescine transport system permease protein
MLVFSSIRFGSTPQINALATIIVFIVSIGVIMSGLIALKPKPKE